MEDKLNQWVNQVDGKAIESEDSSNYAQCFDLAFNWCDFLGIPRDSIRHLNAYQIFTDPNPDTTQYWQLVANTPTGVPPTGALVIWGTTVGPAGHVAIFKSGDTNSFKSEDQNWSGIQKAKEVNHTYNGVIGWLTPTIDSAILAQPIAQYTDQTKIPASLLGTTEDMEIQAIRGKLGDLTRAQDQVSQSESANKQQAEMIADLQKKLDLYNQTANPGDTVIVTPVAPSPAANIKLGIILNGQIYGLR